MGKPEPTGEAEPKNPLEESVEALSRIAKGEVIYEHTELARAYSEVSMLADQSLVEEQISPLEAIELKLGATKDARTAAHTNSDFEFAVSLTQTAAVLEGIQSTLKISAAAIASRPAHTSVDSTSGAKA